MSISRIDHNSTHGYQVRVVREGKEHSKHFSDNKYGGKKAARKAAIDFERALIKALGPPKKGPRFLPKNNKSGYLGVSKTRQYGRKGLYEDIWVWQATWVDEKSGKPVTTRFSENKYGEKAKLLAIASRREKRRVEELI